MSGALRSLALTAMLAVSTPGGAAGETVRVATWDVGLTRDGAGVLLRDLGRPPDPALAGVLAVIREVRPDVLLLTGFDTDHGGRAVGGFQALLRQGPDGIDYTHSFAGPVNAGERSGFDLDGDGRTAGWADGFGWGKFPGHGGMALLSRLPIDAGSARSFRLLAWAELPGALLPVRADGSPYPDAAAQAALRLSSRTHWDVPVELPGGGRLHLLAANPTPPLFDGAERFNARRNHDEIRLWSAYLSGAGLEDDAGRVAGPPEAPLVVLGNLNADPLDGAGLREGIAGLLAHPRLQDPRPASLGGAAAASAGQRGDPSLDTADWREDGPGNLRVDYVLPSAELGVAGAGVFWPVPGEPLAEAAAAASDHRLVWVDIRLPHQDPSAQPLRIAP
jgi:hypothetical protein